LGAGLWERRSGIDRWRAGGLEGSTSLGSIVIGAEGTVCLPLTSADLVYLVIVCYVFWSKYFLF